MKVYTFINFIYKIKRNLLKKVFFLLLTVIFLFFIFCNLHFFQKQLIESANLTIDKVFIINLDKDKERLINTKRILLKVGFEENQIERFPAIFGLNIKIYDYKNNKEFTGKDLKENKVVLHYGDTYRIQCSKDFSFDYEYKDDEFFSENKNPLNSPAFGVNCSHLMILQEGLKRKYNNIVIAEDDIFFYQKNIKKFNLQNKLNEVEKFLPKDFELLYLGSGSSKVYKNKYEKLKSFFTLKKQKEVNKFSDFYNVIHGSYMMLFSKKGMTDFLNKSKKIRTLISDVLYSKITLENDKTYFLKDNIFFQQLNTSETSNTGNKINKVFLLNTNNDDSNYKRLVKAVKDSIIFQYLFEEIDYKDLNIKIINLKNKNTQLITDSDIIFEKNQAYQIECDKNVSFNYDHKEDRSYNYYYKNIVNFCLNLKAFKMYEKSSTFNKNSSIMLINDKYKITDDFSFDYLTYISYRLFKRDAFLNSVSNLKDNIKLNIKLILANGDGELFKCYRTLQLNNTNLDFNLMFFKYKDIEKILQISNVDSLNFNDIISSLNGKFCFILKYS